MLARLESIAQLPVASASTIKKQGWKAIMRALSEGGKLVVTNHSQPEAVILSMAEYGRLLGAARAAANGPLDPLQRLRENFDERLAALGAPDAGDRLRNLMQNPGQLDGAVKAGSSY